MQIFVKTRAFLFSLSLCFLLFLRFFFLLFACSKVVVVFLFLSLSLENSDLVKTRKNWTEEESAFDDDDDARGRAARRGETRRTPSGRKEHIVTHRRKERIASGTARDAGSLPAPWWC